MATDKCIKCGSYAFNLYKEDIDQGGLCDVHYWQYRAHRAEALAEQPAPATELREQEPVAHRDGFWCADLTCKKCYSADFRFKHKNSVVNESLTTPAQRKPLTDEQIETLLVNWPEDGIAFIDFARAIEAAHGIKENT